MEKLDISLAIMLAGRCIPCCYREYLNQVQRIRGKAHRLRNRTRRWIAQMIRFWMEVWSVNS